MKNIANFSALFKKICCRLVSSHENVISLASNDLSEKRLVIIFIAVLILTTDCLFHFQDSRVAIKACEGLLLCTSILEDHAASVTVLYTAFCERMVSESDLGVVFIQINFVWQVTFLEQNVSIMAKLNTVLQNGVKKSRP